MSFRGRTHFLCGWRVLSPLLLLTAVYCAPAPDAVPVTRIVQSSLDGTSQSGQSDPDLEGEPDGDAGDVPDEVARDVDVIRAEVRALCPTLSSTQIAGFLSDLQTFHADGGALAEARLRVAGWCVNETNEETAAVGCTLCQAALLLSVWTEGDPLPSMCPTLNEVQITQRVAALTALRARGDSLSQARLGVGNACLHHETDEDAALTCALCEAAITLQVWGAIAYDAHVPP